MQHSTIETAIAALQVEEYRIIGMMDDWTEDSETYKRCTEKLPKVRLALADLRAQQAASAAVGLDENGLLPCPFCGSKAEWGEMGIYRWVYCSKKHCWANRWRYVGDAAWIWNQRATWDSAPAPQVAKEVDGE